MGMIKIKNTVSIVTTKLAAQVIKVLNLGDGTNLPGRIARRITPEILTSLVNQSKKEIITVTGTNGKTTTCGFISGILNADGRKIAHNKKGANMLAGITTALVLESSLLGNLNVDHCLIELDEAYSPKAFDEFNPEIMLVTNLFRDQLDRYGELDVTAKKIHLAIEKTIKVKPLTLVLNADDPIVANIVNDLNLKPVFYGFDEILFVGQDTEISQVKEIATCKCGENFEYNKLFYGHIGHYYCKCGIQRPIPRFNARVEITPDSSLIIISEENGSEFQVNIKMPGLYNAYNALGAIIVAKELGISAENIVKGLEHYDTVFGRAELLTIKEKQVLIQLIKNSIGASEVLRTVKDDKNSKLLIIINDNYADGRDVSWLWDANFELIANYKKQIVTSGERAEDMATRLKYVGINPKNILIEPNIEDAISYCLNNVQKEEKLYILPTYTALLNMQKILKKF